VYRFGHSLLSCLGPTSMFKTTASGLFKSLVTLMWHKKVWLECVTKVWPKRYQSVTKEIPKCDQWVTTVEPKRNKIVTKVWPKHCHRGSKVWPRCEKVWPMCKNMLPRCDQGVTKQLLSYSIYSINLRQLYSCSENIWCNEKRSSLSWQSAKMSNNIEDWSRISGSMLLKFYR